jgi:transcriptional regulator with XRE-family HTH domain
MLPASVSARKRDRHNLCSTARHVLETFGARLRRQRDRQQVSLAAIAEQTKIKVALLDALERDDVSQWAVGISDARTCALREGRRTRPEALVREFLEQHSIRPTRRRRSRHSAEGGRRRSVLRRACDTRWLGDAALSESRRAADSSRARACPPRSRCHLPPADPDRWPLRAVHGVEPRGRHDRHSAAATRSRQNHRRDRNDRGRGTCHGKC